ncbi:MAG TPA: bifunctional 3-(3-hydroxy-phenyl)propionate/3-hydroxycinnamic acid hydroxylase [Steroidobacter sp.]
MTQGYDVAVVGYGACSAVLVNLLLARGLSVIVFDKEAGVLEIPRAAHMDDETLRTFQTLGAADDLAPTFTTSADYGIYNALDQRVWGFTQVDPKPTDQGWLSDYWFFQPDVEHYLRAKASRAGITAKLHCEVTQLAQRQQDVLITYRDLRRSSEQTQQVAARYVVGADGARSFVRKQAAMEMESLAPSQRWMIVDIRVHDGVAKNLSRDCWTKVTPEETITFVPMPKNMQRFEFSMKEGLTESDVKSRQSIEAFISKWFKPGDYDVLRADVYHFHSLVAKTWRKGRVLIAGDAAHLMPPFLGQGVCSAIRDALNLAWKLARVVHGESSEALLDTYGSERRPHSYTLVKIAGEVGNNLKWMANATPEELAAMPRHDYAQARPPLGPGVYASPGRAGGTLAPQPLLADGRLLDYRVGYNFALVGDPALIAGLSAKTAAALERLATVLVPDDSPAVHDALTKLGGAVMLVRPDRYLVGVADSVSEIDAVVARLTDSLHCTAPA